MDTNCPGCSAQACSCAARRSASREARDDPRGRDGRVARTVTEALAREAHKELIRLVDEDTRAFNGIMDAFGLAKNTEEEQEARKLAIEEATLHAIRIPHRVMHAAFKGFELAEAMIIHGNPNSLSDAGVGALALHACIEGAWLNVMINASDLKTNAEVKEILKDGGELLIKSRDWRDKIGELVKSELSL